MASVPARLCGGSAWGGAQDEGKETPPETGEGPGQARAAGGVSRGARSLPDLSLLSCQLPGTPGGRQGSLITYSLFFKNPIHGNGQYITIPRKKKIFSPRNLKMALFNSDVC